MKGCVARVNITQDDMRALGTGQDQAVEKLVLGLVRPPPDKTSMDFKATTCLILYSKEKNTWGMRLRARSKLRDTTINAHFHTRIRT